MNPEESLFFDIGIASLISSSFQFSTAITEAQPTAGDRGNAPSRRYLARNVTSMKYHPALSAKRSISPPAWQAAPPQPLCNLSSPTPNTTQKRHGKSKSPRPRDCGTADGVNLLRDPEATCPTRTHAITMEHGTCYPAPLSVSVSGVQATRAAPARGGITINGYRDRDACHPATRSGQYLFLSLFFPRIFLVPYQPDQCPSYLTRVRRKANPSDVRKELRGTRAPPPPTRHCNPHTHDMGCATTTNSRLFIMPPLLRLF